MMGLQTNCTGAQKNSRDWETQAKRVLREIEKDNTSGLMDQGRPIVVKLWPE